MLNRVSTLLFVGATVCAAVFLWPGINFYILTGRWMPIHIVENLTDKVAVIRWTSNEFVLADDRVVSIPHIRNLLAESATLSRSPSGKSKSRGMDNSTRSFVSIIGAATSGMLLPIPEILCCDVFPIDDEKVLLRSALPQHW